MKKKKFLYLSILGQWEEFKKSLYFLFSLFSVVFAY